MKRGLLVALVPLVGVFADGAVFPADDPPNRYFNEVVQYAIIEHNGSKEVVHIMLSGESESERLAWVISLPADVQIEKDSLARFDQFVDLCRPMYYEGGFCKGGYYYDYGWEDIPSAPEVELGDGRIFQINDPDTLYQWLIDRDYWVPRRDEACKIFGEYIDRGWVFVVFEVNPVPLSRINLGPVIFRFTSSEVFYPMRISTLNPSHYSQTCLYVIAAHRMEIKQSGGDKGDCLYANKLNGREYEALQQAYPLIGEICKEGDFITSINVWMGGSGDFEKDYVLGASEEDKEAPNPKVSVVSFPLLPLAFAFIVGISIRKCIKSWL
jgi:hypothetical protein